MGTLDSLIKILLRLNFLEYKSPSAVAGLDCLESTNVEVLLKMIRYVERQALSLAILCSAVLALNTVSRANAENLARGRVTVLDGIPYYVGDIPVSQLLHVPPSTLDSTDLSNVDILPMTVVSSNSSELTGRELNDTIAEYSMRDDVFSSAFLNSK